MRTRFEHTKRGNSNKMMLCLNSFLFLTRVFLLDDQTNQANGEVDQNGKRRFDYEAGAEITKELDNVSKFVKKD